MNLRQKAKSDFRALAGLKTKANDSPARVEHDPKLDMIVNVSLTKYHFNKAQDDLILEHRAVKTSDTHEVSDVSVSQYVAEEKNYPNFGKSDPKLKMACKVHLVRLRQTSCSTNKTVSYRSDSKFNMLCKVILHHYDLHAVHRSKRHSNIRLKQNGLLKAANHYPQTNRPLSTNSSEIEVKSHNVQPSVTNECVTEPNKCQVDKMSNCLDKQMNVDTLCHAVCDHAVPDKSNVGYISDNNKEAEPKQKTDTTARIRRRKIVALKDHNEIVPRKRAVKKKITPTVASENIPEVVVEKCTDRIPVYKKLDENARNSLNRKSNPYEFTELDPDPDNKKPKKKRRKVGVKNKKSKNVNMIYNKCIKQIMNKLAITVQSNKFVARGIEKSPKKKAALPTQILRVQTKRPKVKFKDITPEQTATDKEMNRLHDLNKIQVNNVNMTNKIPLNVTILNQANLPSKNIDKLDDNDRIKVNPKTDGLKHGKEDAKQGNQNGKILHRGVHRKYENKKNMNPRRLFCESNQPSSPKLTDDSSDNSNDMFDFYNDACNSPKMQSPIHQEEQKHASSNDQHLKMDELLDEDDPDMSFASQISINRCASACSEAVEESHYVSPTEIADDDPYFGFGADDDNVIEPSPEITKNRLEMMHQKKGLPTLERTRKTDSPWRYTPRNISFNPHFVRLKPNALPVINQDPVLDSTYDENIRKHHPELTLVERTESQRKKSPVQKSILSYITSNIQENKENTKRLSMFDDEEFSPIKIFNKSPTRLEPNKTKRNILGALSSNIIVHSIVTVSTPQKNKHSDHMESPNLSVIVDELRIDRKTFKRGPTKLQTLNNEIRIASNIDDDYFHGFSVNHLETSRRISSKIGTILKEHEKTEQQIEEETLQETSRRISSEIGNSLKEHEKTEQQIEEQTLFGFGSLIEDENIHVKEQEKICNGDDKNNDAKPFRLSLNGKRIRRKNVNPQNDDAQIDVKPKAQLDSSDSEDDFIPPTPIPENESLKVGLFDEIESKKPSKTYRSRKRYREFMAHDSGDEEDIERHRKKKKDQPTKAEVEEFDKWAAQFNAMCDEVEKFPLEVD